MAVLQDQKLMDPAFIPVREAIEDLCSRFGDEYWADLDRKREYPEAFVQALTDAGWLSVLIPEEFGGGGQPISVGSVVLETINRCGASAAPAHAQMYTMGTILRHGNDEQKNRFLPKIAKGELRLQAFGITEADAGSDTTRIKTRAVRDGDHYVINGGKIFTSRFYHSDLMLLLTRTTPFEEVSRKTEGISVFLVDLRDAGDSITARPIKTIANHETAQLFFDDLVVPAANRIGEEGKGFRCILSGLNAERILVTSEVLGSGFWFVEKAAAYGSQRVVFNRPIAANQGVQFPIAQAYANLTAASALRWAAVHSFEAGEEPSFFGNAAKLLASQGLWAAANAAMDTYGGYGVTEEYGIERKFREARTSQIAPISNNLVLSFIGHNTLQMPRSY